jgi:hypothetical protein
MVEKRARSVRLQVVLILLICMACLLVHFCAKNSAPSAQPFGLERIGSGELDDQSHDSGEDSFVFPNYTRLKILQNSIRAICPESLGFGSISFRPLLPPPIAG